MRIREFREFDSSAFAVVHDVLRDPSAKSATLSADALDMLQALAVQLDQSSAEAQAQFDDQLNLLRAAAQLQRFFVIRPPEAPGLYFCGGELRHDSASVSVGAMGLSFVDAFKRCVGEAVEYWSQIESSADESIIIHPLPLTDCTKLWPASWLQFVTDENLSMIDCIQAQALNDDLTFYLPADLCLRRANSQFTVPYKLSSGCAVGPTFDHALCKALTEVIERDAVALWWYGGVPPKRFSQDQLQQLGITELVQCCRGSYQERYTVFLDVSSDLKVPVVVAYSFDRSGSNFVCGMAAHLDLQKAVEAALLELCQMELGLALVRLKIEQSGRDALSQGDTQQLQRATQIQPDCKALGGQETVPFNRHKPQLKSSLGTLKDCINSASLKAYFIDITKPSLDIPAVKVVLPELQAATIDSVANRLQTAITTYKGGWGLINKIDLY